ncbi:HAMP domain-containing histidine kinase, partial [Saprospiraceae bacterium]|nr:HAMP domain-containing histidine kinase [Saprospiraceae bacterium]
LRYFNRIINTGVTDDLSFSNKLRTQLCNQSVLIATAFLVIHIIETTIFSYPFYEVIISASWIVLLALCFYFNYKHLQKLSQTVLIFGSLILMGLVQFAYGPETKLETLYISTIILGLFLLRRGYWLVIIIFTLSIYFLNTFLYPSMGAPLEQYLVETAPVQYFIFSIVLSTAVIAKVLLENSNNHKLLKLQNKKMSTQNEELKRFNYIVSHDLKEPIRSIVGLTGLLAKKNTGAHSDITDEIVSLGTRLNNMVNDIVKFQELDKMEGDTETFLLSEVIQNVKSNISKTMNETKAEINCSGIDEITGSKTCTYLILKNLIENGIKYNSRKPKITIDCSKDNRYYSMQVTDNGIGIPNEYHDEVFVMFKRLNQLKTEKGTGLGLSISKKIAQKYGATLDILKSSDEGTTFVLKKPVAYN